MKCHCATEVRPRGPTDDVILSYAVELSAGGCFVRANRAVPTGTALALDMALDDSHRIVVQGLVLYSGPASPGSAEPGSNGFAVGFTVMDRATERTLYDFLGDAAPRPAGNGRPPGGVQAKAKRARKDGPGKAPARSNGHTKPKAKSKRPPPRRTRSP